MTEDTKTYPKVSQKSQNSSQIAEKVAKIHGQIERIT